MADIEFEDLIALLSTVANALLKTDGSGLVLPSALVDTGAKLTYTTTTEAASGGAVAIHFNGLNGSYTDGLYLKSTGGTAYGPHFIVFENTAYGRKFNINVGNSVLDFFTDYLDSYYRFSGYSGNIIALQVNVGLSSGANFTPRIQVNTYEATSVGQVIKLAATQSANAFEVQPNGSTTPLMKIDKDGAILGRAIISPKATAYTILGTDSRTSFTNEGAAARVDFTLPTAVAGYDYEFIVQDADGIRVIAAAGDTIRNAGNVSAAAGRIDNATIGSVVRIKCINATEWIVVSAIGTWTVT